MPLIFYVTHDGNQYEADVAIGDTVMQGAVNTMIDGIVAECGGSCVCSTCHCYVDEAWAERIGPATGVEADMVAAVSEPKETSRLSCQITVSADMEGLTVHLPASQY